MKLKRPLLLFRLCLDSLWQLFKVTIGFYPGFDRMTLSFIELCMAMRIRLAVTSLGSESW